MVRSRRLGRIYFAPAVRPEVGTAVVGPGPVAEIVAVALGSQNGRGALVLPIFTASSPRPGRAIRAGQVAVVFVAVYRGTAHGRHHHNDDSGDHRRPATTPVAPSPRCHLEKAHNMTVRRT